MIYYFRLAARVLLYASSHRQDNTHHGLCYTSRGSLAGTRNSSVGPPWRIDPTTYRIVCGYSATLALRIMKKQTLLPSLSWICLVSRLVYLKGWHQVGKYIFPTSQDDWNDAVVNTFPSEKNGSPLIGDAAKTKLSCVRIGHKHFTHWYIWKRDHPPQCKHCRYILTVRHILLVCIQEKMWWNQLDSTLLLYY